MLPRRNRLSREGFDSLSNARRYSSKHFSVAVSKSTQIQGFGVVVSKKVSRLSVGRHLIKRRIYSVLKDFGATNSALIVYVRPGAEKLPFSTLRAELTELLQEAGIR